MKSTVLPLELYFEHRNYLPAMLLFWPLGRALFAGATRAALRGVAAIALLALCAVITSQRADLWGKPEQMARLWALQNPASSRAQGTAAEFEKIYAQYRAAPEVTREVMELGGRSCARTAPVDVLGRRPLRRQLGQLGRSGGRAARRRVLGRTFELGSYACVGAVRRQREMPSAFLQVLHRHR